MAVPSWEVRNSASLLNLDSEYYVFEDLVECVAGVQFAIGVWGSIVQDKCVVFRPVRGLPLVKVIGASPNVLVSILSRWTWPGRSFCQRLQLL